MSVDIACVPTGVKRNKPTGVKRGYMMLDNENTNNAGTENTETGAVQTAETTLEKKFTQTDMDNAMAARLKRERTRIEKQYSGFEQYKQIYNTLAQNGVINPDDPDSAVDSIQRFYARTGEQNTGETAVVEPKKTESGLKKDEKLALTEFLTEKSLKSKTADEIEDEYQTLKDKGKKRTDEEDVQFNIISRKYAEISVKKSADQQRDEFQTRFPKVQLDDLKNDADFAAFAKISRAPLADTYETYLKLKGAQPSAKSSVGSVSTQGGQPETALFSKDELKKMPMDEAQKNMELVRKSILANIQKSVKT